MGTLPSTAETSAPVSGEHQLPTGQGKRSIPARGNPGCPPSPLLRGDKATFPPVSTQ